MNLGGRPLFVYLKRARPRRHVLGESSYAQKELREVGTEGGGREGAAC